MTDRIARQDLIDYLDVGSEASELPHRSQEPRSLASEELADAVIRRAIECRRQAKEASDAA
jgi:hypothetical protein